MTRTATLQAHIDLINGCIVTSRFDSGKERQAHGILHAIRVALLATHHNTIYTALDPSNPTLNENDILHLQILALLHNSARKDDKEDLWGQGSALDAYVYLQFFMRLDEVDAQNLAKDITNKDCTGSNTSKKPAYDHKTTAEDTPQ